MANQFDKAEQAIGRYLAFRPSPPKPMLAYATGVAAMLQKMQGKDERGQKLLTEAKKLDPNCWITFMQPARALFPRGFNALWPRLLAAARPQMWQTYLAALLNPATLSIWRLATRSQRCLLVCPVCFL